MLLLFIDLLSLFTKKHGGLRKVLPIASTTPDKKGILWYAAEGSCLIFQEMILFNRFLDFIAILIRLDDFWICFIIRKNVVECYVLDIYGIKRDINS